MIIAPSSSFERFHIDASLCVVVAFRTQLRSSRPVTRRFPVVALTGFDKGRALVSGRAGATSMDEFGQETGITRDMKESSQGPSRSDSDTSWRRGGGGGGGGGGGFGGDRGGGFGDRGGGGFGDRAGARSMDPRYGGGAPQRGGGGAEDIRAAMRGGRDGGAPAPGGARSMDPRYGGGAAAPPP